MEPSSVKSLQCPNCGANVALDRVRCDYCRSVLTVTSCPSCFGAIFKGMRHCPNCGAAVERVEVDPDKKRLCPRCDTPLVPADIASVRIHECHDCGGLWIDAASFDRICEDREKQEKAIVYPTAIKAVTMKTPAQKANRFYVPCPECGELMNQKNFAGCSGIVIDLCKPHGIWFDRQELQQIINFIKDGGLQKARAMELEKLKEEQNRLKAIQQSHSMEPVSPMIGRSNRLWYDDESVIGSLIKRLFGQDD